MGSSRVPLIATKSIKYGGKWISAGKPFSATEKHARLLKAVKRAKDPEPSRYDTKDMLADVEEAQSELSSPKRQYRRQNLTAKP